MPCKGLFASPLFKRRFATSFLVAYFNARISKTSKFLHRFADDGPALYNDNPCIRSYEVANLRCTLAPYASASLILVFFVANGASFGIYLLKFTSGKILYLLNVTQASFEML